MADKHELLVSKYRRRLIKQKYSIIKKSPLIDYRPDIYAVKGKEKIIVEAEIEKSIHNDHTLNQLDLMYKYVSKNKNYFGILIVPLKSKKQASFLIESVFGDNKIKVIGL